MGVKFSIPYPPENNKKSKNKLQLFGDEGPVWRIK